MSQISPVCDELDSFCGVLARYFVEGVSIAISLMLFLMIKLGQNVYLEKDHRGTVSFFSYYIKGIYYQYVLPL